MIQAQFDLHEVIKQNRGKKICGFIELAHKVDSSMIRLPYMIVSGAEDGPVLLADCCTHGDEYEGSEGISKAYHELDPAALKGAFVGVPAVNLEAFNAGQRTAPIDWSNQDMNRAFPGNPEGMLTSRVTHFFTENFLRKSDYIITFHGGGNGLYLEPLSTYEDPDTELGQITKKMAKAFGVRVLWQYTNLPFGGTENMEAVKLGKPCICVELGGQGIRNDHRDEMISLGARGISGVMQELKMLEGTPVYHSDCLDVEIKYVHTDEGGYHKLKCKAMDFVKKGQVCSEIVNIFGEKIGEVTAPFDCWVVGYWCYSTIHPGHWAFLFGSPID